MDTKAKLILLVIAGIFVVHALSLNFTQDDAFISYRYVKNFVDGQGLVFNPGERVEGYTNFLWIILLSIFGKFGLDIIVVSKILGVASGCASLFLLHKISVLILQRENRLTNLGQGWFFAVFPSLLLASNSAFAYWSISGLETIFFFVSVLLTVYFYFINQRLMVLFAAVSTLIRPEGALVFIIIILHKLLVRKDELKGCLFSTAGYMALLLPFLVFKMVYYGDVLPNSFYAKTGFSSQHMQSGLEYFWLFLKHYGLWGALYLLPVLFYKRSDQEQKLLLLFIYLYTLYVIIIGGDVLMVHRFFLPVLPFLYLFFTLAAGKVFSRIKRRPLGIMTSILLILCVSAATLLVPKKWIKEVRGREEGLVEKMRFWGETLSGFYGSNFVVAASTIGALSYYVDAKVIDMLGLTDRYISRHPETIPGMVSSWKERKFNTRYLLSLDPDFILFSTERKPSAPAERALFLNSKFRENYYPIFFLKEDLAVAIFRIKGEYLKKNRISKDIEFVNLYNEAFNLQLAYDYRGAVEKLKKAVQISPNDFAWVYELMGEQYFFLNDYSQSEEYLKKAIQMDDQSVAAHFYLFKIYQQRKMVAEALREKEKVLKYSPGFFGASSR